MAPKARLPDQARVRLPYFQSLGQQWQPASAASRKCVTYHPNLRRVIFESRSAATSLGTEIPTKILNDPTPHRLSVRSVIRRALP